MASILMIDDDLEGIMDVRDILAAQHEVDVASNVNDAVCRLTNTRYDLLFLDLYMPHGDKYRANQAKLGRETGYLLLKEIRSSSSGFKTPRDVPVMVLTFIRLSEDEDLRERLMKEQPLKCMEKPEDLLGIIRCVEQMLRRTDGE